MIKRLTQREQSIALITLILSGILVSYYTVIQPFKEKKFFLEKKIIEEQKQLKKNLKLIREAEELQKEYAPYLEKFKQEKPNEQVMSGILSEIETAAAGLDVQISDLKPKRVKEEGDYNQFSVSLTIDSSFLNIVHFLHILQSEPHLFEVEELEFDKGSQRKSETMKTRLVLTKVLIPQNTNE